MSLPEVALDDVRFQELVNESRRRVAEQCHEWTEVNVSDPGITLIELFAWMTDMLSYRINRLPEKLHVALLSLLGVELLPALAARTELCFRLDSPPRTPVPIKRETEVATRRTSTQESVVFATTEEFTIKPAQLEACLLQRGGQYVEVGVSNHSASPPNKQISAFGTPPAPGDCLLLGFSQPLDRLLIRVEVECNVAHWTGVDPNHPPLAWEVSAPASESDASATRELWLQPTSVSDTTKGFNLEKGSVELQLPANTGLLAIDGRRFYWLRCRVTESGDRDSRPPEILALTAATIGATIPAQHARAVENELLGESDGTPGETFKLRHAPILALAAGECLQVREPGASKPVSWQRVDTFADSAEEDTHYMLDETTGEIELGPAVRQADGRFKRYGALTEPHSELSFNRYRQGGGSVGNVAAKTLTYLREPIDTVRSVTNVGPAAGGADPETLAEAGRRAAIELRTRDRAITREDFERLCVAAHTRVARACCLPAKHRAATSVYIVPHVSAPPDKLSRDELEPDDELLRSVADYLEERRLVGTSIAVAPAGYRVVVAVVYAVADRTTEGAELQRRIEEVLYRYLNPLVGGTANAALGGSTQPGVAGSARDEQGGWQFGRALRQGELYPIVRQVDGVQELKFVHVYEEIAQANRQSRLQEITHDLALREHELIASGSHRVKVDVLSR
jgi:predicted phage baseplate assembly protein